ncbi:unnamed protein product [Prorocentrum cordatum]|uniref:Uncharacterized protein n=1 Tax=Prorocentrum cordatum TaxID=2364126 RepID=A0ABN9WQU2_9DINO|nr:unnamed protein product [Polarella glacialis]
MDGCLAGLARIVMQGKVGLGALGEDAAAEPRAGPAGPRGRGGLGGSGAPRAEDEWVDLAPLDCRGDTLRLDTLEARSHPSSKLSPPLAGEAPGSQAGLYASSTEAGLQQPAPPKRGPPLPGEAWAAEASPLAGDAPTSQVVRSYWDQALGASPAAPAPPPAHGRRSPHWEGAAAHSAMYSASEQAGGGGRSPELGVERAPLLDDAEARRAEAALLEQGRAAQLEQQARRVEREAEALKRLQAQAQQSERDVQREREKLWQEVEAEKRALHEEFDAERAALRRERRRLSVGAERQRQQLLEDREAQQERQRLQEQNLQLEEEMREKEKRWQRSIDRLQRQVADLTRKNAELQEEVRRANQQAQQAQGGHAWGDAKDSKDPSFEARLTLSMAERGSVRRRHIDAGSISMKGNVPPQPLQPCRRLSTKHRQQREKERPKTLRCLRVANDSIEGRLPLQTHDVKDAGPSPSPLLDADDVITDELEGQPARRALSGGRYSESRLAVDSIGSFDEGLEHGAAGAASGAGLHARHAPELTGLDSADRGAGSLGPPVDSDGHADPDELQESGGSAMESGDSD